MKLSFGYMTAADKKEAREIALALLEKGLVACVNILPGAESYFIWENEIVKENEVVLVFKTREKNEEKIIKLVRKLHSYHCPCVVFLPLTNGNPEFARWVEQTCSQSRGWF